MKGVILAGGRGTRLGALTQVTNKHLLPVYNKPMIYYPVSTMIGSGITEILIISSEEHLDAFKNLLEIDGRFAAQFSYKAQKGALGIAHALKLAEDFAQGENIMVLLGDNIFEETFKSEVENFKSGAKVFLKEVDDPHRFGIAELQDEEILSIQEKPENPKSSSAVTGMYIYDSKVFEIIEKLDFSERGELEITDVNNVYLDMNEINAARVHRSWTDAGTFESLFEASKIARKLNLH